MVQGGHLSFADQAFDPNIPFNTQPALDSLDRQPRTVQQHTSENTQFVLGV